MKEYAEIVAEMAESDFLQNLWINYCKDNPYVGNLSFKDVIETVKTFGSMLEV